MTRFGGLVVLVLVTLVVSYGVSRRASAGCVLVRRGNIWHYPRACGVP